MVNFSRRWNGDGCFSPTMEWRWFLIILTITIDGSWQIGFSNFWDQCFTMVTGRKPLIMCFFHTKNEICDKIRVNKYVKNRNSWQLDTVYLKPENKHGMKTEHSQVDIKQGTSCSRHSNFFKILQKLSLVCLISASA